VAEADPPRPPRVKQHTPPFEQLAELVHERAAPPWHCPMPVQAAVPPPRPPSGAQQTWVAAWHVEAPHAMPPPLLPPLLEEPLLLEEDPDAPLLEPLEPLEPLDEEPPLEVDPDPPLDPEADADPPLDPDSSAPSVSVPGISGTLTSSSGLRDPHPEANPHPSASRAATVDSSLVEVMDM
jgi:hypothetical protein